MAQPEAAESGSSETTGGLLNALGQLSVGLSFPGCKMGLLPSAVAHLLPADLRQSDRLATPGDQRHHLQAHKGRPPPPLSKEGVRELTAGREHLLHRGVPATGLRTSVPPPSLLGCELGVEFPKQLISRGGLCMQCWGWRAG